MKVLVVGSAECVWDDLRHAPEDIGGVIAVNSMIRDYPNPLMIFGASVHFEKARQFRRDGIPMVCPALQDGVDICYDQQPFRRGTSALYAVGFALLIGARQVILAGAPLDESPHYNEARNLDAELSCYRDPWQECLKTLRGRVFSLSGWTRDLLGSPL